MPTVTEPDLGTCPACGEPFRLVYLWAGYAFDAVCGCRCDEDD